MKNKLTLMNLAGTNVSSSIPDTAWQSSARVVVFGIGTDVLLPPSVVQEVTGMVVVGVGNVVVTEKQDKCIQNILCCEMPLTPSSTD